MATIMIVSCHIFQHYNCRIAYWLDAGVQIFFFMSGFLFGQRRIIDGYSFIKKHVGRILLDYYVCLFIDLVLYTVFTRDYLTLKGILGLVFFYDVIEGLGHLWFIPVIVCLYIATPVYTRVIDDTEDRLQKIISNHFLFRFGELFILLVFFLLVQKHFQSLGLAASMNYGLGLIAGKSKSKSMSSYEWLKHLTLIFVPLALIGTIVCIYHQQIRSVVFFEQHPDFYSWYFYPMNHVCLGIALFCMFYSIELKTHIFQRHINMAQVSDRYSYDIYLSHHIWIQNPHSVFNLPFPWIIRFILMIILVTVQTVLTRFLSEQFLTFVRHHQSRQYENTGV